MPLNPGEAPHMQMFIWNNLFFSLGFDIADHYQPLGGNSAAHAAAVCDLRGAQVKILTVRCSVHSNIWNRKGIINNKSYVKVSICKYEKKTNSYIVICTIFLYPFSNHLNSFMFMQSEQKCLCCCVVGICKYRCRRASHSWDSGGGLSWHPCYCSDNCSWFTGETSGADCSLWF